MIETKSLRVGNILSLCYEQGLEQHMVEVLQQDLIHLSGRLDADDPRDVVGIPVTPCFLRSVKFKKAGDQYIAILNNNVVTAHFDSKFNTLIFHVDHSQFVVNFIHELQNIIFFTTGFELISQPTPGNNLS